AVDTHRPLRPFVPVLAIRPALVCHAVRFRTGRQHAGEHTFSAIFSATPAARTSFSCRVAWPAYLRPFAPQHLHRQLL
ncbi:hypothetical protein OC844_006956, partial [Tilletia horrida]